MDKTTIISSFLNTMEIHWNNHFSQSFEEVFFFTNNNGTFIASGNERQACLIGSIVGSSLQLTLRLGPPVSYFLRNTQTVLCYLALFIVVHYGSKKLYR